MSGVSSSIPKYRHHKGSGQAFVQIKGKRHYLGSFGSPKSKEAYSRFVAELAVNPVTSPCPAATTPAAITVVELAAAYLDFAEGIRRAARRLLSDGLSLVVVDYIGLVEPDDYRASREQQVARVSRGLKNLAKELNVPVLRSAN